MNVSSDLDRSAKAEFVSACVAHCLSEPMQHEPCRLLSDADRPGNLVRADAIFAVRQEPHGREPLLQGNSGILKDCPDLDGILFTAVPALIPLLSLKPMLPSGLSATLGALRAISPLHIGYGVDAHLLIGEVSDCI